MKHLDYVFLRPQEITPTNLYALTVSFGQDWFRY